MQQSQQLERLASDLHAVAFDFAEPARTTAFAERRIAEVERICIAARAVVRGRRVDDCSLDRQPRSLDARVCEQPRY